MNEAALRGLALRWALPEDVKVIAATWLNSARRAWHREPDAVLPGLEKHAKTIAEARKRMARALAKRDKSAAVREEHLLDALFDREFKLEIQRELLICPAAVLYDKTCPILVIGWAHARAVGLGNWVYVKEKYRRIGYGAGLFKAIAAPAEARMMTRAGRWLMTSTT